MKRLLLPFFFAAAIIANAQDRMTPELLWSLKRVSGEGMHPNGRTIYYSATTYNVKTEQSTAKKYTLDVRSGEKKELSETKTVFQRDASHWYASDDKAIYQREDNGRNWRSVYKNIEGA